MVPSKLPLIWWDNSFSDTEAKVRIKVGFEQSKLVQAHQSLISVISAALGNGASDNDAPPANTLVPQNMDQMRFAFQSVLGSVPIVG